MPFPITLGDETEGNCSILIFELVRVACEEIQQADVDCVLPDVVMKLLKID